MKPAKKESNSVHKNINNVIKKTQEQEKLLKKILSRLNHISSQEKKK